MTPLEIYEKTQAEYRADMERWRDMGLPADRGLPWDEFHRETGFLRRRPPCFATPWGGFAGLRDEGSMDTTIPIYRRPK